MSIFNLGRKKKEKMSKVAIRHSNEGEYTQNSGRLKSGGHGEKSFSELKKRGQAYNILQKYPNGIRLGNVPNHKQANKQKEENQAWFPKKWTARTIKRAGENLANSISYKLPDRKTMFGTHKGVRIGMKRDKGKIKTVFPLYKQSGGKKNVKK